MTDTPPILQPPGKRSFKEVTGLDPLPEVGTKKVEETEVRIVDGEPRKYYRVYVVAERPDEEKKNYVPEAYTYWKLLDEYDTAEEAERAAGTEPKKAGRR